MLRTSLTQSPFQPLANLPFRLFPGKRRRASRCVSTGDLPRSHRGAQRVGGLVEWLQPEGRVTRRQIVEGFDRRSLWYRERNAAPRMRTGRGRLWGPVGTYRGTSRTA
jgi:hypothetical protein